mmetsp:Transcript_24095/g.59101  ORF Transcript_24095/g.59101 Transcript_24095/m.59101 type:complete len:222 (-) Transcript_24095:5033-5698(-)
MRLLPNSSRDWMVKYTGMPARVVPGSMMLKLTPGPLTSVVRMSILPGLKLILNGEPWMVVPSTPMVTVKSPASGGMKLPCCLPGRYDTSWSPPAAPSATVYVCSHDRPSCGSVTLVKRTSKMPTTPLICAKLKRLLPYMSASCTNSALTTLTMGSMVPASMPGPLAKQLGTKRGPGVTTTGMNPLAVTLRKLVTMLSGTPTPPRYVVNSYSLATVCVKLNS